MTAAPRLTRRALVDVIIHVPAIVCLDPRWTPTIPSPQRPQTQRRDRAATVQSLTSPECAHSNNVEPGS